jgi:hypothetical protein
VLLGGTLAEFDGTWEFDGCNWVQVAASGPSPRLQVAMTYHALVGRVVAFGGYADWGTYFGDTWSYDTQQSVPTWFQEFSIMPLPVSPPPRAAAAIAPFVPRSGVVLFGGRSPHGCLDDTWLLWGRGWGAAYGAGCSGSRGVPNLRADWSLQSGYRVDLQNLPVAPGAALLLTGFGIGSLGGLPLPMDLGWLGLPGCDLWVAFDPAISLWIAHNGLTATMTWSLPNAPVLSGLLVANQCLSIDPGAPGGIGAMSNACIGTIN